jgi:hypothetical protein
MDELVRPGHLDHHTQRPPTPTRSHRASHDPQDLLVPSLMRTFRAKELRALRCRHRYECVRQLAILQHPNDPRMDCSIVSAKCIFSKMNAMVKTRAAPTKYARVGITVHLVLDVQDES